MIQKLQDARKDDSKCLRMSLCEEERADSGVQKLKVSYLITMALEHNIDLIMLPQMPIGFF